MPRQKPLSSFPTFLTDFISSLSPHEPKTLHFSTRRDAEKARFTFYALRSALRRERLHTLYPSFNAAVFTISPLPTGEFQLTIAPPEDASHFAFLKQALADSQQPSHSPSFPPPPPPSLPQRDKLLDYLGLSDEHPADDDPEGDETSGNSPINFTP